MRAAATITTISLCLDFLRKCRHDPTFTKIRIPNEGRTPCLVALNKMNINRMTLFPDIDGAARYVNSIWQPGHEDLIAFINDDRQGAS